MIETPRLDRRRASIRGSEEQARNLGDLADPVQRRYAVDDVGAERGVRQRFGCAVGFDECGSDRIDANAAWRELVAFSSGYYQRSLGEVALAALPPQLRELDAWLAEKGVGVVFKPFDIDDLLVAVRKVLEGTPAVLGHEDSGGTSIASRERRKERPAPRD